MKWFQVKEQSAGKKRLILTWYLYKIFGKRMLYFIAFIVSFFTFVFAKKLRVYSKKYFSIIQDYTGIQPNLINCFRLVYSYACSLADKIILYCGDFSVDNIKFEGSQSEQLFADINKGKGVFFICNHIGNIEIMQAFFLDKVTRPKFSVNVFMSKRQSKIFNSFLNEIKSDFPIRLFPIEDMGINTGVEIKEAVDNGGVVFIAGDRLSENNDKLSEETVLFSKKILLPKGTFKLAGLIDVPTYFITALKSGDKYIIEMEKQNDLSEKVLVKSFTKYLERIIKENPFQFYHFYDFFE